MGIVVSAMCTLCVIVFYMLSLIGYNTLHGS